MIHHKMNNFTPNVPATKIFWEIVIERQVCILYVNEMLAFTIYSNMEETHDDFSETYVTFSDINFSIRH